jgi:hypothetical protein
LAVTWFLCDQYFIEAQGSILMKPAKPERRVDVRLSLPFSKAFGGSRYTETWRLLNLAEIELSGMTRQNGYINKFSLINQNKQK